jgi:hypothetical protein
LNKKIDIDFSSKRRDEVFSHLYDKYKSGFAHIGIHGTLQPKNAFKDVCRIFSVPFSESNLLSSLIPDGVKTISEAMEDSKFAEKINASETLKEVIKYSAALEGTIKSYGVHACIDRNAKVKTSKGIVSIKSAYRDYIEGGSLPIQVWTNNGYKRALIHKTERRKAYTLDISDLYGNKFDEITLSSDHKFPINGNRDGISYKEMEFGKNYIQEKKFVPPEFYNDIFIASFLCPLIACDVLNDVYFFNCYSTILDIAFNNFAENYILGKEAFIEKWGSDITSRDYKKLFSTISSTIGIANYNNVIGFSMDFSRKVKKEEREKFFLNLFSTESFLSGLFSGLVNLNVFEETYIGRRFRASENKIYSKGIMEILSYLYPNDVVASNDNRIFFKDSFFYKFISYNHFFCTSFDYLSIKVSKVHYRKVNKSDMYDIQILTSDENLQFFVANSLTVHNCGIILSPVPLDEHVPLFAVNDLPVTMYDSHVMEYLNFIKVDLLGIKVLAIIDETLIHINKSRDSENKIKSVYDLPLDDKKTFELLCRGDTSGVFQLEGASVAPSVALVKPSSIHDIAAMLGIWRPGPLGMSYDKMYIERKNNPDSDRDFYIPRYNHIFEKTYGLGIYQEQYMILLQEMCGFDPIKTDVWRKGVGKKQLDLLASLKIDFLSGGIANGNNKNDLEDLWDKMSEFGLYAFNASHAYSYAYLSYFSAYLKANFPIEFYCACISCETDPEAQSFYVNDARRHNIKIVPPDINYSEMDFSIVNGKILYGFKGLKGVGEKAITQILENRSYSSFADFLKRIVDLKLKIPKQVIEALIKIGAFDSFGVNKRIALDSYDKFILDYKNFIKGKSKENSIGFVDDSVYFQGDDVSLTLFDILSFEKQYMGIYISGNPFDFAKEIIGHTDSYDDVLSRDGESVFCEVVSIKITKTKSKGEKMGIYKCIDKNNQFFEFPLFPNVFSKMGEGIEEGSFLIVNFTKSNRGIICKSIKNIKAIIDEHAKTQKSEASISSILLRFQTLAELKQILGRKEKMEDDPELIRPCHLFFSQGSYTFKLGSIEMNSSSSSIRLINQVGGIDVKLLRK